MVAVVAVAGAAAGPIYYSAAQTSIMRDAVEAAPVIGRGFEVVQSGPVGNGTDALSSTVASLTGSYSKLFEPAILSVEATAFDSADQEAIPLVSRTGVCDHLRFQGSCPHDHGQILISASLASTNNWKLGQSVTFAAWGPLTVTGIYQAPVATGDYWFDRASNYFPYEYPAGGPAEVLASAYDAMFTPPSTLAGAPASAQGNVVIESLLDQGALRPAEVAVLKSGVTNLINSQDLQATQAVATSNIPQTMAGVTHSWASLAVPLVVITLQLLVLAWLVLFLLVGDAVAARGPDVALAKLRGFGGWRTAAFGLFEPSLVVVAALPVGGAAGWGLALVLGHVLLRPGTPTSFPTLAIATAAVATAAGIVAVVVSALGTLRRPVLDQWRKAEGRPRGRTWVLDTLLLTGAAAGLIDLVLGGQIDSAHHSALSLLVPGLLGLGVAVVASRMLPLVCRALAASRIGNGIATFLALRHVARRPGGARTTILLATSFAVATFAVSVWAVERSNYRAAAGVTVGAPAVLTVQVPQGRDLGSLVARADPSGRRAAAVDVYSASGSTTLAVDARRWAAVASWPGDKRLLSRIQQLLAPPTASPLILNGDSVRVNLSVSSLTPAGTTMVLDVQTPTGLGETPVQLGALPQNGDFTASAAMPACPCRVQDLTLVPDPSLGGGEQFDGSMTVRSFEVHDSTGWHQVDASFSAPGDWRASGSRAGERAGSSPGGLAWSWSLPGVVDATVAYADVPETLPALAPSSTAARPGELTASGLDGHDLPVDVVAVAKAVPGLATGGVVVDRRFAEIDAGGNLAQVVQQVWVGNGGNTTAIASRLRSEGVQVTAIQTQQDSAAAFRRAGPGLAGVLFLAEAALAAAMAAAGAILGLAISARRRRYEMASLEVVGIGSRTLSRSVVMEQVMILGYGVVVGIATGLGADALVLRVLPEFTSAPPSSVLSYAPPAGLLTSVLVIGAAAVVAIAAIAGAVLVKGTRLSQLREGAQ
ncbi:MAG TPA: FtsX-like permease family protein [Acidimicrobiales bacterium]|nr:FtsX-like permease family protein [Acidimicrobiales bacterium]